MLEKEANGGIRAILTRLLSGLREGKRFSSVLAEQPELFPPLYIGIVRAAEGTSDLPRSLTRFIDYQQRIDSVRSKIISAAIYPVILLMVGGGVSLFLIGLRGAALCRGLSGRRAQSAMVVATVAGLGPVCRQPYHRPWLSASSSACWRWPSAAPVVRQGGVMRLSPNCPASASACGFMNCRACI